MFKYSIGYCVGSGACSEEKAARDWAVRAKTSGGEEWLW